MTNFNQILKLTAFFHDVYALFSGFEVTHTTVASCMAKFVPTAHTHRSKRPDVVKGYTVVVAWFAWHDALDVWYKMKRNKTQR